MADRILILGASARSAAASARRAGLTPFAVDLFADRDTQLLCERVERCPFAEYPRGLFDRAKAFPPMPWMYTGGLENYPELVGVLAHERELWGNGPEILTATRDPFRLSELLSGKGLYHPQLLPTDPFPPDVGRWLRKPLRGSAGHGIRFVEPSDQPSADHFYQAFVDGEPMSAVFIGGRTLGVTRQLIGTRWLHTPPFRYAGNIGPLHTIGLDLQDVVLSAFRLWDKWSIRGVHGIDFVHDGQWSNVIESNPRYPASAELIDFADRISTVDWHRWSFWKRNRLPVEPQKANKIVGKAVYYTAARFTFPASGPWDESLTHAVDVWRRPDFADIPHPGEVIEPGQPVLTILTDADTEAECLAKLKARAAELDRLFGFPTPEDDPCPP